MLFLSGWIQGGKHSKKKITFLSISAVNWENLVMLLITPWSLQKHKYWKKYQKLSILWWGTFPPKSDNICMGQREIAFKKLSLNQRQKPQIKSLIKTIIWSDSDEIWYKFAPHHIRNIFYYFFLNISLCWIQCGKHSKQNHICDPP